MIDGLPEQNFRGEPPLFPEEEARMEEAVVSYFAFRCLDHLPPPQPSIPSDVEDIARMAILWTELPADTIADCVPQIRGLMAILAEQFSRV